MEAQHILNVENDTDLFCLHYVFIPSINSSLEGFRQAWNCHPLSTEGNRSPLQLYTGGSIGSDLFEENIDLELYRHDPEAPYIPEEDISSLDIPDTYVKPVFKYYGEVLIRLVLAKMVVFSYTRI